MTAPRGTIVAIVLAAAAIAALSSPRETWAASEGPLPELRRSIQSLFAPAAPRRVRRPVRKAARLHPAPLPPHPAPLPRPRPAQREAGPPPPVPLPPQKPVKQSKTEPQTQTPPQPPAPPPPATAETPKPVPGAGPSACQLRLTPDIAVMHPLPPITGPGQCGAEDVVSLDAVMTKDGHRVALTPAATLRCGMAEAVVKWLREEVMPAASTFGSAPRTIVTAASYECRGRNRVTGAKLSEHGRANALDVRGLTLANGTAVDLTDKAVAKEFRDRVRQSACARFRTVLGPGSDGYHEKHVHLDLLERRGGFRMCQWDVSTPPDVADVPMPPDRPRTSTNGKH